MKFAIISALVLVAVPFSASAEPEGHRGHHKPPHHFQKMKAMDTNDDKKVDFNEFLKFSKDISSHMFDRYDINKDGIVTRDEFEAAVVNQARERFEKLDRNGDGILDRADRHFGKDGQKRDDEKRVIRILPHIPSENGATATPPAPPSPSHPGADPSQPNEPQAE